MSDLNGLVVTKSLVAIAGVVLCTLVIGAILASRDDLLYQRDRVLLGLAIAHVLATSINTVPFGYNGFHYFDNSQFCAVASLSTGTRFFVVFYELFLMLVSLFALQHGELPRRIENILHPVCVLVFFLLFGTFLGVCRDAYGSSHLSTHEDDDITNDAVSNLLGGTLHTYLAIVALILLLWIIAKIHLYNRRLEWAISDQSTAFVEDKKDRLQRRAIVVQERQNYARILAPLRGYISLFLIFSIPVIVFSFPFCSLSTPCTIVIDFVLAFHAICFALLYFSNPLARRFLRSPSLLFRKITERFSSHYRRHSADAVRQASTHEREKRVLAEVMRNESMDEDDEVPAGFSTEYTLMLTTTTEVGDLLQADGDSDVSTSHHLSAGSGSV